MLQLVFQFCELFHNRLAFACDVGIRCCQGSAVNIVDALGLARVRRKALLWRMGRTMITGQRRLAETNAKELRSDVM